MSVRSGGHDIDWSAITQKLPTGRDTASSLRRTELFNRFDMNKNGVLSLAEVDKAIREVMGLDSMFSSKAVMMRAFQAAKDGNKSKKKSKTSRKDDFVERDEFRLLLVYLRQYFELFVAFNRIDSNSDQKVNAAEFRSSLDTLAKWGINISESEADREFQAIDTNEGGEILFDEFCHWAIMKNLDIEDDDDFEDDAGIGFKSAAEGAGHLARHANSLAKKGAHSKSMPQMPAWKKRVSQKTQEANAIHANIVHEAEIREEAAKERLLRLRAKVQRELTKAASMAAIEDRQERRRQAVALARAESDHLIGRDMTRLVADVPQLAEEEVKSLSELFNAALRQDNREVQSFFQLFKDMDIDGSRRIAFSELERLVRIKLRVTEKKLSHDKLLGLWKVLDENASGFIDAGELSRFLRIGAPKGLTPVQLARKKLLAQRAGRMQVVRDDSDKIQEKDVAAKLKEHPPATEEQMKRFGTLFLKQLSDLRPRGQDNLSMYGLFKQMDVDGSGRVKLEEFDHMIRYGLKATRKAVPEEMVWSLWRAIDENANGFICAGEFGRFMRTAADAAKGDPEVEQQTLNSQLQDKIREDQAVATLKREETWARSTAISANEEASKMEAEAARLEALLANVGAKGLMRSTSSAALARQNGRAEAGELPPASPDQALTPSPAKRKEMIQMLSREMKTGGSFRAQPKGKKPAPMLLPSLAREEGHP